MNIQQRELEDLGKEGLRKRDRIIPVVGDDAFEGIVNVNGTEHCFPLQRWLAEKLLGDKHISEKVQKADYLKIIR